MPESVSKRKAFLDKAASLMPRLHETIVHPHRRIEVVADAKAFQGWAVRDHLPIAPLFPVTLLQGESFSFEFPSHVTGQLTLRLRTSNPQDAPVRLRLMFGEVPGELGESLDAMKSALCRAWMQDETINIDIVPADGLVTLPRRYAFRYLRIDVIAHSNSFKTELVELIFTARSSADASRVSALPASVPEELRAIDEAARRTLSECMQTVFEDGPKRDRRLWLGDLRLQALTNYATFGSNDLVRRCLYLFAGLVGDDGIVNADIYEYPTPARGNCRILDYAALFPVMLLEYLNATGDRATTTELLPTAMDQLQLLKFIGPDGVFVDPGDWWLFIDWEKSLDKQACEHAILVLMVRALLSLNQTLGGPDRLPELEQRLNSLVSDGRKAFFDSKRGVVLSGKAKQISTASQAWWAIAGLLSPAEAARALTVVQNDPTTTKPAGPYCMHVVVDALLLAGLQAEASDLLLNYWGQMINCGLDTFPEVFAPADQRLSPYGSYLMNSYCHAWSCTPAYFIRARLNASKR